MPNTAPKNPPTIVAVRFCLLLLASTTVEFEDVVVVWVGGGFEAPTGGLGSEVPDEASLGGVPLYLRLKI
jgi:hypothetical protein